MFSFFTDTNKLREERNQEARNALNWQIKHETLQAKWNGLVTLINRKGGQDFLDNASLSGPRTLHQFSDDELRSLLQLVHPDKHGGKQSAVTMTQKINALRG